MEELTHNERSARKRAKYSGISVSQARERQPAKAANDARRVAGRLSLAIGIGLVAQFQRSRWNPTPYTPIEILEDPVELVEAYGLPTLGLSSLIPHWRSNDFKPLPIILSASGDRWPVVVREVPLLTNK